MTPSDAKNSFRIVFAMIKVPSALIGMFLLFVASAEAGSFVGVWGGTLGAKSIVACFNGGGGHGYGSYYYKAHLKPIRLTTRSSENIWYEDNETGLWNLAEPENGVIVGEWSSPKTNKTYPIRLQALIDKDSEAPACARDSYNLPLEKKPPALEIGKPIRISGEHAYRTLRFAGAETIELIGAEAGLPKINSVLKPNQSAGAIEGYFQQRREFLGRVGYPAVDHDQNSFDSWIGKLVTIVFITRPAGFGASSVSIAYRTWNVDSGEEVDLWSWFGLKRWRLSPKFERLLLKKMATEECLSRLQYKSFNLAIEKTGFKFFSDGPSDECPDELRIPYAKAVTLMTPQGRQQFEAIIGK